MKLLKNLLPLLLAMAIPAGSLIAQCATFSTADKGEEAKTNHVLYRDLVKQKNYQEAFPLWEKAYSVAPAADGQRNFHYKDGRLIYKAKFEMATDAAEKKSYADMVVKLYDEEMECYPKLGGRDRIGYLNGRKGYDMFYIFNSDYVATLAALSKSIEASGNDSEYIVLAPYATITVYNYTNKLVDKDGARAAYKLLNEIADHNIANNEKLADYYKSAKASVNAEFAKIEANIFDCDYFRPKLVERYKADPDNRENYRAVYAEMIQRGCDKEDPILKEILSKDASFIASEKARIKEEFAQNNPGVMAKRLYDSGDYDAAIAKYQEAISGTTESDKISKYNYSIANIKHRKKKDYSGARSYYLKAAEANSGWGDPYMKIGEMYAASASSCGKDAFSKAAAICAAMDMWGKAKSIDSSVAGKANQLIGRYSQYLPAKEDAHMRSVSEGQSYKVGCWIQTTTRIRLK